MPSIENEISPIRANIARTCPEVPAKVPSRQAKDLGRKVLSSFADLDSLFPGSDVQVRSATTTTPYTKGKPDKVSTSSQKIFGRREGREVSHYERRDSAASDQDPYVINGQIIKAESLDQLLNIYTTQGQAFNHINLCTWVHRVAKKSSDSYQKLPEDLPAEMREALKSAAEKMIPHVRSFDQRAIANAAWAFAKLGIRNDKLFHKLSESASRLVESMDGQAVSNLCWAYATLGIRDLVLFDDLAIHVSNI